MTGKLSVKTLYGIIFFVWFTSRILVLTSNYTFPINDTLLQIIYIVLTTILLLSQSGGIIKIYYSKHKTFFKVSLILLIHTILWGTVLKNPLMGELTGEQFRPQIMFIVIVILTACAIIKFDAMEMIIKLAFYALSITLTYQLLVNISDLNLSNIANIMDRTSRTRVHFGFGHYNTLGGACLCNVILWSMMKKENFEKIISNIFVCIAILMLLCSASRSSLTGLILFATIIFFERFSNVNTSVKKKLFVNFIKWTIFIVLAFFALNMDVDEFLVQSQRSLLFYHALPTFWESGRVLQGLGYVSNTAYGTHLTPYTTYWLDNGYIYVLISTGVIGFCLIMYVLYLLLRCLGRKKDIYVKTKIFPILCVYMYIALFEANLFNSGSITSYIYIAIFLFYAYKTEENLIVKEDK